MKYAYFIMIFPLKCSTHIGNFTLPSALPCPSCPKLSSPHVYAKLS